MSFLKILAGVMVGVLLALKLKASGSPIGVYLSIALSVFVLFYMINRMTYVVDFLDSVMDGIGLEEGYLQILVKIVGISYLCEFTSNICREAGFPAVAGQVEISGKLTMMILSMPVLFAIVDTITGII